MMGDKTGGFWRLVGGAIEGTGGVVSLTVAPDSSQVWILHWLRGWHDDNGGARTIEWFFDDNVVASPYRVRDAVSVAANAQHMFYGADMRGPVVLEMHGMNVILQGTGILAGKYLQYTALVEVFASPVGKLRMSQVP